MASTSPPPTARPSIGIIMLDTVFPRLVGDVGNPKSFPFPVLYETVSGASPERVVARADPALLQPFCNAGRRLKAKGVKALFTSCGFLAIFQQELVEALDIPVFSSSLLQIHQVRAILPPDQEIGIITANSRSLGPQHFAGLGITRPPQAIVGLQEAEEFPAVFLGNKMTLDPAKVLGEMSQATRILLQDYPQVGAVILECTNMSPYALAVQQISGLPVFDVLTMIHYVYQVVSR